MDAGPFFLAFSATLVAGSSRRLILSRIVGVGTVTSTHHLVLGLWRGWTMAEVMQGCAAAGHEAADN